MRAHSRIPTKINDSSLNNVETYSRRKSQIDNRLAASERKLTNITHLFKSFVLRKLINVNSYQKTSKKMCYRILR